MIPHINPKKSTDAEILSFIRTHRNISIYDCSDVEMENFKSVRKEAKRRKIGPFQLNVLEARDWK